MRDLHGVLEIDWHNLSRLKQYALAFDKLRAVGPPFAKPTSGSPFAELYAEVDFLHSNGLIDYISRSTFAEIIPTEGNGAKLERGNEFLRSVASGRPDLTGSGLGSRQRAKLVLVLDMAGFPLESDLSQTRWTDYYVRKLASRLGDNDHADIVPICRELPARYNSPLTGKEVLQVTLDNIPTPNEDCAWEDVFEFRKHSIDKQWALRRFLHSLGTKKVSEAEVRDEIEWTLSEYTRAMEIHRIKASQSFLDVFLISPLEIMEDVVKFNWSKIAKGALQVRKRKVELMEAEMKAPGRECAYVFDARTRFGSPS